MHKAKTCKII